MDELAVAIPPEAEAMQQEVTGIEARAQDLAVTDEQSLAVAGDMLGYVAGVRKRIEALRTSLVKPLNDHVKRINDLFRGYAAPLDRADATLRAKVSAYRAEQERIRREEAERLRKLAEKEQARLERQAAKKGVPAPPPIPVPTPPAPPKTVAGEYGSMTARKEWRFDIVDEAQVPRQYLVVDEARIRAAIRAGIREIPGVRIYQVEIVSVRGR